MQKRWPVSPKSTLSLGYEPLRTFNSFSIVSKSNSLQHYPYEGVNRSIQTYGYKSDVTSPFSVNLHRQTKS